MKLTNPVGRNVSLNADNDINPRACMCRNGLWLQLLAMEPWFKCFYSKWNRQGKCIII